MTCRSSGVRSAASRARSASSSGVKSYPLRDRCGTGVRLSLRSCIWRPCLSSLLQCLTQDAFLLQSSEATHQLAFAEQQQGRNGCDPEARGELAMVVDVHFIHTIRVSCVGCEPFENG